MAVMASGQLTLVDINDSKQLQLFLNSSQPKTQIFNPDNSTYTPSWTTNKPVVTPQVFVAGDTTDLINSLKSIKWFIDGVEKTASDTNYTLGTGNKSLTINTNVLSSATAVKIECEVVYTDPDTGFDIKAKADIEFVKVSSGAKGVKGDTGATGATGASAIMAVLTNDSHTVTTNTDGSGGSYGGATSTIMVYEGGSDVSASWTVTATPSAGVTGSLSGKTYTVTAMSVDTGYVDFTATRSGYATITKRFTIAKNKQGVKGDTGTSATSYWLVSSNPAISKSDTGTYTPGSITVSGKSQTGSSAPVNYSGRFIIAETTDGTNYTTRYTSSANEASKTHTPSAGIKAVKVSLYLAGGTTNLIDEQVIPVVSDGVSAVRAVVWTPEGNTVRNSSGSLKAICDVYRGSDVVTASYQWYIQDPTQTTDVGGGIGWKKLTSTYNLGTTGYTAKELTIPASAIVSVESFKCVATYNAVTYSDVCTVNDVSDPIQVVITGANMFKNGEGSVTLRAKLFRAGVELDVNGTDGYTYAWSIYDANNVKNTGFAKTGKEITVLATDITVRGNVVCEVSN